MQDTYYQERDQILLIMKKIYHDITLAPKKYHHYTFLKIKDITKDFPYSTKIKYILLTHSTLSRSFFGIQLSHVDQKTATMLYN